MIKNIVYTFILFVFAISGVVAQDHTMTLSVKGRLIDVSVNKPVPYAHVINMSKLDGTTTDEDGYFTIDMKMGDTIYLRSVGFTKETFTVDSLPLKSLYVIPMRPNKILLDEVEVIAEDQLQKNLGLPNAEQPDIPMELRGSGYNEKPSMLKAAKSPLSYANHYLSSTEREKRKILETMKEDESWENYKRYYNFNSVKRLTKLNDADVDRLMIYINTHSRLQSWVEKDMIELEIIEMFGKWKAENDTTKTEKVIEGMSR